MNLNKNLFILLLIPLGSVSQTENFSLLPKVNIDYIEDHKNDYKINLGNIGLPESNLLFTSHIKTFEINTECFLSEDKKKFYSVKKPLTDIGFKTNYKNQSLSFLHTQNINQKTNFYSSYLNQKSEGFYKNQSSYYTKFNTSIHSLSKNNRYQGFVFFKYEKINSEQNGGVKNDSVFKNTTFSFFQGFNPERDAIEVNLDGAEINKKKIFVSLLSNFYLGKKEKIDSVNIVIPRSVAYHKIDFFQKKFSFKQPFPSTSFYPEIYIDTNETSDTTYLNLLTNKIGFFNKKINTDFYMEINSGNYGFIDFDSIFYNIELGISAKKEWNKLTTKIKTHFIPFGINKLSYSVLFNTSLNIRNTMLSLNIYSSKTAPSLLHRYYKSNHFLWNNNFDLLNKQKIQLLFSNTKNNVIIEGSLLNIYNYIYYNEDAIPVQYSENFGLVQIIGKKTMKINKLKFVLGAVYQKSLSDLIHIPNLISKASIYYDGPVFRNKAFMECGTSVFYFSNYYANAYMPSTGVFYLQDEIEVGHYPIIDLFLNLKIKDLTLELKFEHINSGLMGFNYFYIPNYPIADRNLRFGVNWKFMD